MIEINSTKINPDVIPHLHIWGWEIPIYLFLGGLSAGLLILSSLQLLIRKEAAASKTVRIASLLSPLILGFGMLFLFLDLANKIKVWRFYTAFVPTSPMSWGSWILIVFMPFSFAQAFVLYRDVASKLPIVGGLVDTLERHLRLIAKINVFLGVSLGAYTGILLSSLYARPLWSNSAMGFLFLMSGLSAAAAFLLLIAPGEEKHLYSKLDFMCIGIEIFAVGLFVIGALNGSANAGNAMVFLLTGPYAQLFWSVTISIGIVVPFVFEGLEVVGKMKYIPAIPVLVLVGSLSLRFVLVYAGQEYPTFS